MRNSFASANESLPANNFIDFGLWGDSSYE